MPSMKNYLLGKVGGFTILIMVAFVLAVPIALAKSKFVNSIPELREAISGLDAQYILVCGGVFSATIYTPDLEISSPPARLGHVFLVNLMMSDGWQPLGGVSGTGYGDLPICQAMIKG